MPIFMLFLESDSKWRYFVHQIFLQIG
jgi:hypothetical protein